MTDDVIAFPPQKPTTVQTLILHKDHFTLDQAEDWVEDHGYKLETCEETADTYRFRQRLPKKFWPGSFRTITFGDGVAAVIGKLHSD